MLNAANEIAVALFLEGRIGFTDIPRVIENTMNAHRPAEVATLAAVREVDRMGIAHTPGRSPAG